MGPSKETPEQQLRRIKKEVKAGTPARPFEGAAAPASGPVSQGTTRGGDSSIDWSRLGSAAYDFLTLNQGTSARRVQGVIDADTMYLRDPNVLSGLRPSNDTLFRVRDIDAPETSQPFGRQATQFVRSQYGSGKLSVAGGGKTSYNRTVADLIDPTTGRSISEPLVAGGYAWNYPGYSQNKLLPQLESTARQNRLGLWGADNPTAPWLYRAANRK